ncbi:RNA polymerase sigma factor SigJ [Spongiactinospora sp. 9N601]|uniref:RNA polymerase sigma factor SigJ n=1 Tax=Spongiactinospora sp. 9N601 TaxID=3375149 RepID=UPI003790B2E6
MTSYDAMTERPAGGAAEERGGREPGRGHVVGGDIANQPPAVAVFAANRNLLFAAAYDILGSVADAEDVVQDTWLRWEKVDHAKIEHPRAYLMRIAVHRAVEHLRKVRRLREDYIGPWLPEPLWTEEDAAERLERRGGLALGLLVVLETLSPLERAAFVLREAFAYEYDEIAGILDRTPAAIRQLVHRARGHVHARRPRFSADQQDAQVAAERFVDAAVGGSMSGLLGVLAPEVTLWNDGGGRARAALRPVLGAPKVARLLAAVGPRFAGYEVRWARPGGSPTALVIDGGRPIVVVTIDTDPSGRVRDIYGMANPDKLAHLARN